MSLPIIDRLWIMRTLTLPITGDLLASQMPLSYMLAETSPRVISLEGLSSMLLRKGLGS